MLRFLLIISRWAATNPVFIMLNIIIGSASMARLRDSVFEAFWWFVPCLFVILADLSSGIHSAKTRGERVRFSGAARRTVNKMTCYLCWIIFCVGISKNFHSEKICLAGMAIVFLIEGVSFINNLLEPKGIHLSLRNIIRVFGKRKGFDGLEEIIENNEDNENKR